MAPDSTTPSGSMETWEEPAETEKDPQSAGTRPDREASEAPLDDEEEPCNAIPCAYPGETLNLATEINGIEAAVKQAIEEVLGDYNLRPFIPLEEISAACKDLQTKMDDHKAKRAKGLVSPIPTAKFAAVVEDDYNLNEGYLREEMMKYLLLASSRLDKLSIGTIMSIVRDLAAKGKRLHEYEAGCPAKLATTVNGYYDMSASEFYSLDEQKRLQMTKVHIEEGIRYHSDMTGFLVERGERLRAQQESEMTGPEKKEYRKRVRELTKEIASNQAIGRKLKKEYELITSKEEKEEKYLSDFRCMMLEMGVRSREEEAELDALFARTRDNVLKMVNEKSEKEEVQVEIRNVPTLRTKEHAPECQDPHSHYAEFEEI